MARKPQKVQRSIIDPATNGADEQRSPNAISVADKTFRGFIENLPVMFYAVAPTPPYKPIYITPTVEKFGYSIDEWMTDPNIWVRVIHPDDCDHVLGGTKDAMVAGEGIDFEYRIVGKNGSIFWVRDRSCFIKGEDGTPICWQGVIVDVTDRKLAILETLKRDKLYRTLARHIPKTAVLLFDRDHRYTLADGAQLSKHGYSQEMFEGMTLGDVFPPDIAEEWSGYYNRALNGESVVVESDTDDGSFIVNIVPVRDEDDEIFAGMVMWQDVSDRRRADRALKESEARYRQLFENANDIIYVHDLEGNYLSINEAGAHIFGYTIEEALALNMKTITAPEHLQKVQENLAKKIAGDARQTVYEIDCFKKNGERVTLEVNSSVIIKDGKPVAVQGVARDVTERKRAEDISRKSEERYRDLFENANDLIYTHDLRGNFTSLNRAGELITGYTREEAVGMNIADVVAPEFLEGARSMTTQKVEDERPTTYELEIIAKDGRRVPLELSTRVILNSGRPVGVQGIGRDISERIETQTSLLNAVSLFASTFESTADGIVVMGLDRNIVTCNKKFIEMWNAPQEIIDSKDGSVLISLIADQMAEPEPFLGKLDALYLDPLNVETDILELKDGRTFERYSQPQFMKGVPVGRVCCFRDVTERNQAESKLRHYALHDTLTNLPNRVQFMNHLQRAIDRADGNVHARFAVLFLDLDRFKVINDSLGHSTGDRLLVAIAERLKACVRPGDVVARLGGDEFTILLNRSGETDEVIKVAERLQGKIAAPFKIDNYEVFTTASIGIIISTIGDRRPEDFLRDADAAMYRAKEAGKARFVVFDDQMHVRNMKILRIETDLRHAVDRNEFEVLYQPIVQLDTGRITEFEALIRWRHPVHGLISPNEFVGAAEETGMIIPIGKWILEESCRQLADWQTRFNIQLSVSVNLSAKQLMHPNLTSQVKDVLYAAGLKPEQLKLEVTESTVMEHSDISQTVLDELAALGVSLSTDDFGTGYSSLSYLQRFPFDRLKIDRSFIDKMVDNEKSGAIVKTILMLGENLGLDVVAEGIETLEQLECLRALGCKSGQGFLFAPPIGSAEAEEFLQQGSNAYAADLGIKFESLVPTIEVADVQ